MKSAIYGLVTFCCFCLDPILAKSPEQANLSATLTAMRHIGGVRPPRLTQITRLNRALDSDLAVARKARGLSLPMRQGFSLAASYLVFADNTNDSQLRMATAQAWRRVSEGMELGGSRWDLRGALAGYNNAIIFLRPWTSSNSPNPSVRGELYLVAARLRALEGNLPVWAQVPTNGQYEERSQSGVDEHTEPETIKQPTDMPPLPQIKKEDFSQDDVKRVELLEQKINGATVTIMAARSGVENLQVQVEARGLSLQPETIRRLTAMEASYRQIGKMLESRQWDAAEEQIGIALGYARRLLDNLGR
jgi:hypothetical protein